MKLIIDDDFFLSNPQIRDPFYRLLDIIAYQGGKVERHQEVLASEAYTKTENVWIVRAEEDTPYADKD